MQWYQCQRPVRCFYPQTFLPFACHSARLNLAARCRRIESNLRSFQAAYEDPKCQKPSRILAAQMHRLTTL